jgi:hypothetical protein
MPERVTEETKGETKKEKKENKEKAKDSPVQPRTPRYCTRSHLEVALCTQ